MKMFISDGDKGGVGKSVLNNIAASKLIELNQRSVIFEMDTGEVAGQADVAPRFGESALVEVIREPLVKPGKSPEDSITKLFGILEQMQPKIVVVNVPANASEVLETHGGLFAAIAKECGVDLRVAYSFNLSRVSLNTAAAVVGAGKFVQSATRMALVFNEHNAPLSAYAHEIGKIKALKSIPRIEIKNLSNDAAALLDEYGDMNLHQLSTPGESPLMTGQRVQISQWYAEAANNIFEQLLPEYLEPESAVGAAGAA